MGLRILLRMLSSLIALLLALGAPGCSTAPQAPQRTFTPDEARAYMRAALSDKPEVLDSIPNESTLEDPTWIWLRLIRFWSRNETGRPPDSLKNLTSSASSPEAALMVQHSISEAPAQRVRDLSRADAFNRLVSPVNRFVASVYGFVTGQWVMAGSQSIEFVFSPQAYQRITPRERELLYLYKVHGGALQKAGISTETIEDRIAKLQARQDADFERLLMERGRWHYRNGRWEEARRTFALVLDKNASHEKARKARLNAARYASLDKRIRLKSLQAPFRPDWSDAENQRVRQSIHEILLEDTPGKIRPLMEGVFPPESLYQEAWKQAPAANPLARLAQAREDLYREKWQYLLSGDQYATHEFVPLSAETRRRQALSWINPFLPLHWIFRGSILAFGNPVNDSNWRDAAVQFCRMDPEACAIYMDQTQQEALRREQQRVAGKLAERYVDLKRFDAALRWHRFAEGNRVDPDFQKKLDKQAARYLLEIARIQPIRERKIQLLEKIVYDFPDSPAAHEAREMLRKTKNAPYARISKRELRDWPELTAPTALDMDPALLDGKMENGELDHRGVAILDADAHRARYRVLHQDQKPEPRERDYDRDARTEIKRILAERQAAMDRRAALENMNRFVLPLELSGSAGLESFDLLPRLLQIPPDPERLQLFRPSYEER
ncbi:MAG: tetratricopeptide repeat protein [Candidatus Sumerlaeia bacterium]